MLYQWETEGQYYEGRAPGIRYQTPGSKEIFLTVIDTLCSKIFTETFTLDLREVRNEVFAPNAFTPNGDGLNDHFEIYGDPCETGANLRIFNRWGSLVYETNEPYQKFWDGNFNGQQAPSGVYTYILLEEDQKVTGFVSLIR